MISSRTGSDGLLLLLPPPKKEGVELPEPVRPAFGSRTPGKLVFNVKRTSKSFPLGPNDFSMATNAGKNNFSICLGGSSMLGSIGRRSASYPASINFPSGGTKLSSPGRSLQRARRTQGWNTGSCIF